MQFTLKALLDDESRKQIRDVILGEARALARNLIDETFKAEVVRIVGKTAERYQKNDWLLKNLVTEIIRDEVKRGWGSIQSTIHEAVKAAADQVVKEKLKTKTVWEAESQEAYIRKIVKAELTRMLKA